ncbi:PTS sugar transporter subunit IIA [Desulfovermiculus halophilus]|uniref:PTS sugar transporter subunit IIA n=1 Tax=Desulfovermiculus halophilus TaxID=339722 RepID=UPI0004826CA6|nr:PTS sugar transporter subunit IIA [Desulfovermiculus halophilus]
MIGILIVTHLGFGHKLLETAEGIVGKQEGCLALSLDAGHDMETVLGDIKQGLKDLDSGDGVLVLTDMFGGTPSNVSLSLLGSGKLEVITGANLPMLLKIFNLRGTTSLPDLALEAKSAGRQGILVAGEVLKRKIANE